MWGFPVTLPAGSLASLIMISHGTIHDFLVAEQVLMAADTIVLHYLFPFFLYKNNLGFPSECEDGGMPDTILCLEVIFIQHIVMRNMTIIAVGLLPVRAVTPGCVLGRHNMAVHAGRGVIRKVGSYPGYAAQIQ